MTDTNERIPVYSSHAPLRPSSDDLRARIPGWGIDLDPRDRPAHPRELPLASGASWEMPAQQPSTGYRERSVEHERLTAVFGTAAPLRGLSGVLRRLSYERYSEARTSHWLLLLLADRVDVTEGHLQALLGGRPDDPMAETAERAGARRLRSELREDGGHRWIDPLIVAGPWVALAGLAAVGARALVRKSGPQRSADPAR